MKAKLLFFVALMTVTFATRAQVLVQDLNIKVLPSSERNVLKIIYAENSQPVTVTFFSGKKVYGKDIESKAYATGFQKKYDVSNISERTFWITVASAKSSATYRMTRIRNGKSFASELESSSGGGQLLVKRND